MSSLSALSNAIIALDVVTVSRLLDDPSIDVNEKENMNHDSPLSDALSMILYESGYIITNPRWPLARPTGWGWPHNREKAAQIFTLVITHPRVDINMPLPITDYHPPLRTVIGYVAGLCIPLCDKAIVQLLQRPELRFNHFLMDGQLVNRLCELDENTFELMLRNDSFKTNVDAQDRLAEYLFTFGSSENINLFIAHFPAILRRSVHGVGLGCNAPSLTNIHAMLYLGEDYRRPYATTDAQKPIVRAIKEIMRQPNVDIDRLDDMGYSALSVTFNAEVVGLVLQMEGIDHVRKSVWLSDSH